MNGTMMFSSAAGQATSAAKLAGLSTVPAVKAYEPGGIYVVCARRRSNDVIEPGTVATVVKVRRHLLPVAMAHACNAALYLLQLQPSSLHTVICVTLAHLVCCCCCAVSVPIFVLLIGTLSSAVVACGGYNDNEASPQGVWYSPYPG